MYVCGPSSLDVLLCEWVQSTTAIARPLDDIHIKIGKEIAEILKDQMAHGKMRSQDGQQEKHLPTLVKWSDEWGCSVSFVFVSA